MNKMQKTAVTLVLAGLFLLPGLRSHAQDYYAAYQAAMTAYENRDYPTFLSQLQLTDSLRPNHPTILYNLAVGYALNDQVEASVPLLERALWMNANLPFAEDKDLESLRSLPAFSRLQEQAQQLLEAKQTSATALTLGDTSLHPEGVAFDPRDGSYYVGSIRQRKIVKVTKSGEVIDFVKGEEVWGIMGLSVDRRRNQLWACSTAIPEMLGFEESMSGKACILKIDLKSGEVLQTYCSDQDNVWLGDLVVLNGGEVFATSSSAEYPAIYQVNEKRKNLETWLPLPTMISLQGITTDEGARSLFVADYREGLLKIDMDSKKVISVSNTTPHPLKGIDGLYYYKGSMIAIHNGLRPFRVVRYQLNKTEDLVEQFEYLDKALPLEGEPTLGTIDQHHLIYVANSPWGAYDKEKNFLTEQAWPPLILKMSLK